MTPFISSRVRKLDVGISGYTDSDSVLNVTGKVSIGTEIDIVPYDNVNNGTLRLEGSAGTLFSISNNLTSGSIFSVNDASGIPSFDVNADGTVLLAPFGSTEYVGIGNNAPKSKLDVTGSVIVGDTANISAAGALLHVNNSSGAATAKLSGSNSDFPVSLFFDDNTDSDYLDWYLQIDHRDSITNYTGGTSLGFVSFNPTTGEYQWPLLFKSDKTTNNMILETFKYSQGITRVVLNARTDSASNLTAVSITNEDDGDLLDVGGGKVRIDSSGNVGIGISDPTVPLFVQSDSPSAIFKIASVEQTTGYHFAFGWADNSLYHRIRTSGGLNDGFIIENIDAKVQQNFAADGNWSLTNDGNLSLYANSSGNVGIGISTPAQLLHVAGKSQFDDTLYGSSTAAGELKLLSTSGNNNYSAVEIGTVVNSDNGGISFYTAGSSLATERMRIAGTSGNVGIGTNSPPSKVTINYSDATSYSTTFSPSGGFLSANYDGLTVENTNNSITSTFASLHFRSSGSSGTAAGKLILGNSTAGSGFFAFQLRDNTHTTEVREKVRITSAGNVGIGITSPSDNLQVSGGQIINPNNTGSEITSAKFGLGTNIHFQEKQPDTAFSDRTDLAIVTNTGFGLGESEKIRITAGGNVGIGTSSPSYGLEVSNQNIAITNRPSSGTDNPVLYLRRNVESGDAGAVSTHGTISFQTDYSTNDNYVTSSSIVSGSVNGSDKNSYLAFGVTDSSSFSEGMRLTSTGLGIGTSSPQSKLDVDGDITASGDLDLNSGGTYSTTIQSVTPTANRTISFPDQTGTVGLVAGSTGMIQYNDAGKLAASGNFVYTNGNVGIGTNSPAYKLDVIGDVNISTSNAYKIGTGSVVYYSGGVTKFSDLGGGLSLDTGNTERLFIDTSGNVGIGTTSPTFPLEVNGSFRSYVASAGDIQISHSSLVSTIKAMGSISLALGANNIEQIRIDSSSGNVGIGTQNPTEKLEVSGNIKLSSNGTGAGASSYDLLFYGTSSGSVQKNQAKIQSSAWSNNTNAGVLKFFTNSSTNVVTERMRIDGEGKVGIGTTSIDSRLSIRGTSASGYNSNFSQTNSTLQIISDEMSLDQWYPTLNIATVRQSLTTGSGSFGGIGFSTIDDSNNSGQYDAARIAVLNDQGNVLLSGTALAFYTQEGGVSNTNPSTERLRITSTGNVGIGTQNPAARLHVEGADLLVKNGTGVPYIILAGRDTDGRSEIAFRNNTYTANNARFVGLNNQIALEVAGSERLRIISNGNVGIATTNPQYKLDIVGTLRVSETTRIGDVIDIVPYDNLNNGTLSFEGSAGQLFSITNNLTSGSIFAVNDVSGIPSLDVDADGTVKVAEFGGDVFFTGLSTDTVFVGTNNNTNTNSSRLVVNGSISETVGGIQYPVVSQVDIGTDPNQIPLNQFLGTMAFADFPFLQSGTSTDGASASVTINAESTDLYSQIASYATDVTFDIINLGIGREIKLYLRNTNASARTMTIRASATNTGATAVNLAPGAGTMGAASTSTISLAATSGTTLIYVANIGGNIVGGILA